MLVGVRTIASGFAFAIYLLTRSSSAQAPAAATEVVADCPEQDATLCGRRHFENGTRAFEAGDYTLRFTVHDGEEDASFDVPITLLPAS